jgi:hypothetical protein
MRQRWFGSTGRRVPEIVIEGDPAVPVDEALVVDGIEDTEALREAHAAGRPVVVRTDNAEGVLKALARPEVASVVVPPSASELLELDLTQLTYD